MEARNGQDVPMPEAQALPGEIVTIPNASVKLVVKQDTSGSVSFTLPDNSRAYQFLLDPEGRARLGLVLLKDFAATPEGAKFIRAELFGTGVQTFSAKDMPR